MRLTEADLRFVVETVAPGGRDDEDLVRTLPDYEREGRRFYSIAAREPEPPWPASVFEALAQKFSLAREALNALSDCYLKQLRERYFDSPPG